MSTVAAEIAAASSEISLTMPIHTFLDEGVTVVTVGKEHWKPQKQDATQLLPGLEQAGTARMPAGYLDATLEVQKAAQAAQTEYLLTISPGATKEFLAAATLCRDELEAGLEFVFDDGVEDENDAQLKAIVESTDSDAMSALALDLEELGVLAGRHRQTLGAVPAFDPKHIDDAPKFAAKLRALPPPNTTSAEAKAKLVARNKAFSALDARVKNIRACAKFVFRAFPDIVRKFTSAYERRRRTALRRAQLKNETTPATGTGPA